MDVIQSLISHGLIKKSEATGKYYSACALNEEVTIEVEYIKKEFDN